MLFLVFKFKKKRCISRRKLLIFLNKGVNSVLYCIIFIYNNMVIFLINFFINISFWFFIYIFCEE